MFKKNFEEYDMETSFMRLIEKRLGDLTHMGVRVTKGNHLQIGFDEHDRKLIIQLPERGNKTEFCTTCGSIGVLHFEEPGSIKFHRCLRCLSQFDDCAISDKTESRARLLNS